MPHPSRPPLPIDAALPDVLAALTRASTLVLSAEPGAGKTTRVPLALLEHGLAPSGEIVVLEPRRIAARAAATHVASLLGETPGGRVGYRVRFESRVSPATRLVFETEGLLARRLRDDPDLGRADVVVLDELHERHVATDLALALLRRVQARRAAGDRPLRLVLMSATIDGVALAERLGAESLHVQGRAHPVALEHATLEGLRTHTRAGAGHTRAGATTAPIAELVARAVRRVLRESDDDDGHLLVFLPGAAEIRAAAAACEAAAQAADLELLALHGDLGLDEQARALAPAARRRLLLATNVAETSLTIDGVTTVIDSGLARVPSFAAWSGLPRLALAKVSRASAAQRAGRAGRTRAGRCLRLYTREDHDARPERDAPEILRLDLAPLMLDVLALGIDLDALAWIDPPPDASVGGARALLGRLGALDAAGTLSEIGRAMTAFPAHPRVARLLVEAGQRGIAALGAQAAAGLVEGERAERRPEVHAACDLVAHGAGRGGGRRAALARRFEALLRSIPARTAALPGDDEAALARCLLVAFPDRVARARDAARGGRTLALASGGAAELAASSVVQRADWLVAVDAEERVDGARGRRVVVRSAAAIEPEWLLEAFPDRIEAREELRFDAARERVEARAIVSYDGLVLDDAVLRRRPAEASTLLYEAALAAGLASFVGDAAAFETWRARLAFAASVDPSIPRVADEAVREALRGLCEHCTSFAELRDANLVRVLETRLGAASARTHALAPGHVVLPGGRRVPVRYAADRAPWVESRLQDFFGASDGPRIGEGRVPLVLHLLAPSGRPVQVTTDLAGFWRTHYPEIRRTLERRHPKHAWPEDPTRAQPAMRGRRRVQ